MSAQRTYITTTIPYVNARPHLGFALELVQADVLARHARRRGDHVRALTCTDDNSLKNVLAAQAEGVAVQELVDRNAAAFAALREPLALSFDNFIRTSSDPRPRAGVEKLWQRCAESGDLYRKHYEGFYCVGCEGFYTPEDLLDGRCPEHGTEPRLVSEENWFFRLSRYADRLRDVIADGRLRIEPTSRRNEILALIDAGLHDFSISRSHTRAHGWGIPVPGDPDQVIYVWWDALGNYVTSLGYGTDHADLATWWRNSQRRIHLAGKGVIRFHAVYWPAMLREVPRVGDTDFTLDRLIERADGDLAGGFGNLVHRTITMIHRYRDGVVPSTARSTEATEPLEQACAAAPAATDAALEAFDFRRATAAVWTIVEEANRAIEATRPWELAKSERGGDHRASAHLDSALASLHRACTSLAAVLTPFLPHAAELINAQCTPIAGKLPPSTGLFPRIEL
jgi:methionyl-tRNA synthetase